MSPIAQTIDADLLDSLSESAQSCPRLRSHLNLHDSLGDAFQRMVVAIEPSSYIRPHRHMLTPKPELLVCLRGRIGVIIFDDDGVPEQVITLTPSGPVHGCDVAAGAWHTIVCLEPHSAFLEAKPGPYVPFEPDDFAPWAPEEGPQSGPYAEQLRRAYE